MRQHHMSLAAQQDPGCEAGAWMLSRNLLEEEGSEGGSGERTGLCDSLHSLRRNHTVASA